MDKWSQHIFYYLCTKKERKMLYPLKFEPILMPKIWGGQNLKRLYPDADRYDNIGESWLVSAVQGNESVVEDGY